LFRSPNSINKALTSHAIKKEPVGRLENGRKN